MTEAFSRTVLGLALAFGIVGATVGIVNLGRIGELEDRVEKLESIFTIDTTLHPPLTRIVPYADYLAGIDTAAAPDSTVPYIYRGTP